MACSDFDGQVVRQDPEVAKLAEQFVCVRIQSMNGVNIQLFQFEMDLTWMAFFMNGDDQFYARYGGRDAFEAETAVSKDSIVRVMRQVLELHRRGDVEKGSLEPTPLPARVPEEIPPMKAMIARRKEHQCIHCHDVKVAEMRHLQQLGKFTRDLVFTYPMPSAIGLEMNATEQNRIAKVTANSLASQAGLQPGDVIQSAGGRRVLTQADFSRVLERTPSESELELAVDRRDARVPVKLRLTGQWRRGHEPAWRETLHVAGPNGGFWGQKVAPQARAEAGLPADAMAVKVSFIWGDYTRKSGLKVGDTIVEFDGHRENWRINQLHAHLNLQRNYGDTIALVIRRAGRDETLRMQLPAGPSAD